MNPYVNEDVMWQRLQDVQREAENRRLYGPRRPSLASLLARLVAAVPAIGSRRAARAKWVETEDGCETASDAA